MRGEPIYITFLNYLGGFEYFFFTAEKQFDVEVQGVGETRTNIFPSWPNSWGTTADTVDKTTFRKAKNAILVRSQFLTENQRDVLKHIKTSPVVQIVNSRNDRRTILVDSDSFKIYDESESQYTIQFRVLYTDEIATQK